MDRLCVARTFTGLLNGDLSNKSRAEFVQHERRGAADVRFAAREQPAAADADAVEHRGRFVPFAVVFGLRRIDVRGRDVKALAHGLRREGEQQLHQIDGQALAVQNFVANGAEIGQQARVALIAQMRPEHTGGVHQLEVRPDLDPLLAACYARAVAGLRDGAAEYAVDERRFAHVRYADDHQARRLVHAARLHALDGGRAGLLNGCHHIVRAAAVRIKANGVQTHLAVVFEPAGRDRVVGQIGLVEDQYARFAAAEVVEIGIARSLGGACVAQFDHRIDRAELLDQHTARFGHMAGIPVDLRHENTSLGCEVMGERRWAGIIAS